MSNNCVKLLHGAQNEDRRSCPGNAGKFAEAGTKTQLDKCHLNLPVSTCKLEAGEPPCRPQDIQCFVNEHLIHAVELFNSLVPSSEAVSMEEVLTSRIHQKVLSNKIDNHLFNILYEQFSAADRACLLSVSSPHAASLVSVILHLQPSEFQVAIKWWLGLDTSCGSIFPLCPGRVSDPLGHHALTCKRGGDVVTGHDKLRDTLAETCRRAHLSVKVEAGSNLTATLALQTS
ncbi:hypothetical protein EMCRGX_G006352 [Ephydatia muelleri]